MAATVSGVGDGLSIAALPLLARTVTADARWIGLVFFLQKLPWVFAMFTGALADRTSPITVMVSADLSRACILSVLAVTVATGGASLVVICFTALAMGTIESLFFAGASAAVPGLVPRELLTRANSRLQGLSIAGQQFVGPGVGGFLFAAAASVPFFGDAASFLISAMFLTTLPPLQPEQRPERNLRREVRDALTWTRQSKLIVSLTAFITTAAMCQGAVFAVLVIYGRDELGLSNGGYGVLLAVIAIGNLIGVAVSERIVRRLGPAATLLWSALVASGAYATCGLVVSTPLAVAALTVEAVAIGVGGVASVAIRQAAIPDGMRGRVGNMMRAGIYGIGAVGGLIGGFVANATTAKITFLFAGMAGVLGVLITGNWLREALRESDLRIA